MLIFISRPHRSRLLCIQQKTVETQPCDDFLAVTGEDTSHIEKSTCLDVKKDTLGSLTSQIYGQGFLIFDGENVHLKTSMSFAKEGSKCWK